MHKLTERCAIDSLYPYVKRLIIEIFFYLLVEFCRFFIFFCHLSYTLYILKRSGTLILFDISTYS